MISVKDIREEFLSFFEKHDHTRLKSASLLPHDDPTLLFVNAGMVPLKNYFTGMEIPPTPRATSSQKCIRAGGKHNDLDNVGYTARHHTFFEMLGNFSFGDYFKEHAIYLAWEFITKNMALPKNKLLVTIYNEDEVTAELWRKIAGLTDDRILRIAGSDNFWSMGDVGPCGPCSEIFYDHGPAVAGGPPGSPQEEGDRFVEIWNLVFMQYEQYSDGTRSTLPKPSIDTGMGLERSAAVMQNVHNNYEIDLFQAIIKAAAELYAVSSSQMDKALTSLRVISDHLRASAFMVADGVMPSNEGRGYVLRRIMRRAMRHAHMLGARETLFHKLTPVLVDEMGDAFPELKRAQSVIMLTIQNEEERFQQTLSRGLAILEEEIDGVPKGTEISGEAAFRLYDTYGFPLDLTQDVLRERGLKVEETGFHKAMAVQKQRAKANWQGSGEKLTEPVWLDLYESQGGTDFVGFQHTSARAELIAIIKEGSSQERLLTGESAELVFAVTPFYAESGGQQGDQGEIHFESGAFFEVTDVQKRAGKLHAHIGLLKEGVIALSEMADLQVDNVRRTKLRAHHSATHLLHAALRNILGTHVTQKGSLVSSDRLRFDFSHSEPVSAEQCQCIENQVNQIIRQNLEVGTELMTPEKAIESGALALFGEKYDNEVRVLSMGHALKGNSAYSVELCGGTHVSRLGDIGIFTIIGESGISAGVRRIEAMVADVALSHLKAENALAHQVADQLKTSLSQLPERVSAMQRQRRQLEEEVARLTQQLAMGRGNGNSLSIENINGVAFIGRIVDEVPAKNLRGFIDEAKEQFGSVIVVFIARNEDKAAIAVGVSKDLTDKFNAVDIVKCGAAILGGKGGGGRPDMAQAGGPDTHKADAALQRIKDFLSS